MEFEYQGKTYELVEVVRTKQERRIDICNWCCFFETLTESCRLHTTGVEKGIKTGCREDNWDLVWKAKVI